MHMHHNATLLRVRMLINAFCTLLHHPMTALCLQGLPFHTPVNNTSIACVQVVCDEIAELGAARGK